MPLWGFAIVCRDLMRMTGTWNDFAVERAESRKEICANIVANDDCFEV